MRHADNRNWAADHIAVIPMIETVEAISNLDEILSVPGIDAIYVGPADLSLSLGSGPSYNDGDPVFADALVTIVAACQRHGVVPGIHATGPLTPLRREQGFRMITVTSDALAMRSASPANWPPPARPKPPRPTAPCTDQRASSQRVRRAAAKGDAVADRSAGVAPGALEGEPPGVRRDELVDRVRPPGAGRVRPHRRR